MTDSEPTTPPGFTLIGWAARDYTGVCAYPSSPNALSGQLFAGGSDTVNGFFNTADVRIPHMHAAPLYLGPVIDLTPVPAVEWVTVGDYSIAECEGYSLMVMPNAGLCVYNAGLCVYEVTKDGVVYQRLRIDTRDQGQACAVGKARELAKQAKGEK